MRYGSIRGWWSHFAVTAAVTATAVTLGRTECARWTTVTRETDGKCSRRSR